MKKRVIAVLMVLVMMLSAVGCGQAPAATSPTATANAGGNNETTPEPKARPLRVAVQSFYCSSPVGLIVERGWDKEAGIPFELSVFNGGAPINEALAAGLWDVAVTGGAFIFALANYDAKLVASQIDGRGGNYIFARKDSPLFSVKGHNPNNPDVYGSPETAKGITILQNTGTTSQYTAQTWLDTIGVSEEDVNIVHMDFAPMYQAFAAGQADCASLAPPHSYVDYKAQGWEMVASLENLNGNLYEATVCTKEAYASRREDIVKFVELLYRANDELIADETLKFNTVKKWYADNGKSLTDKELQSEIDTKPFIGSEQARKMDLAEFAVQYGEFYVSADKIEPDKLDKIKAGVANDVFQDALKNLSK